MIKKKHLTKLDIVSMYMAYIEAHTKRPKSISKFAENNDFDEDIFYTYFKSFKTLEKTIFKLFFINTIALLEKSEDYQFYDPRYKLLTFYFTFFEILTANRVYIIKQLKLYKSPLETLKVFSKLKKSYTKYIKTLNIETIDLKQETLNNVQTNGLANSAWVQLLLTLKFWMDDTSEGLEKTDVFIEKFINTGFDLINTKPIKSLIDLGKFILKEKINFS